MAIRVGQWALDTHFRVALDSVFPGRISSYGDWHFRSYDAYWLRQSFCLVISRYQIKDTWAQSGRNFCCGATTICRSLSLLRSRVWTRLSQRETQEFFF